MWRLVHYYPDAFYVFNKISSWGSVITAFSLVLFLVVFIESCRTSRGKTTLSINNIHRFMDKLFFPKHVLDKKSGTNVFLGIKDTFLIFFLFLGLLILGVVVWIQINKMVLKNSNAFVYFLSVFCFMIFWITITAIIVNRSIIYFGKSASMNLAGSTTFIYEILLKDFSLDIFALCFTGTLVVSITILYMWSTFGNTFRGKAFKGFPTGCKGKPNCYFLSNKCTYSHNYQKGKINLQYPTFSYKTAMNETHHYYFDKKAQRYVAILVGAPVGMGLSSLTLGGIIDYYNFTNGNPSALGDWLSSRNNPTTVQSSISTTNITQTGINTSSVNPSTPPRGEDTNTGGCNTPNSPTRNNCGCNVL